MPIFVSRFSPARAAGANLRRVQIREDEGEDRPRAGGVGREQRIQRLRDGEDTAVPVARSRAGIPAQSQRGDLVAARLRGREGREDTGARPAAARPEREGRIPPGVGAIRTRAERDIERPGRLTPGRENPAVAGALARFANLRAVARGGGGGGAEARPARGNTPELPTARTPQSPPVDRELDARIRMLATRNGARVETPTRGGGAGNPPTPEQISRANTTPEIRENLQADTREVGRGLRRDAAQQAAVNTRQTARAAGQAAENRREEVSRSNEAELRDLRGAERRLERELTQAQRDIRNLENENRRLQGARTGSPAAAAGAIGTRIDVLTF